MFSVLSQVTSDGILGSAGKYLLPGNRTVNTFIFAKKSTPYQFTQQVLTRWTI
jgi:hypothetical protein